MKLAHNEGMSSVFVSSLILHQDDLAMWISLVVVQT